MKKIKMFAAAAMFCAAAFAGYTAYDQATMTDAERMMLANIEALATLEIYIPFICVGEKVYCETLDGLDLEGVKNEF